MSTDNNKPDFNFRRESTRIRARPIDNGLKPYGYSPYSACPYYTLKNAEAVKKYLDAMDPLDKSKSYSFPATRYRTVHTLYSQIYHGWRYLIEREDTPDKRYLNLRRMIRIKKFKNRVVFEWGPSSAPVIAGVPLELNGFEIIVEEHGYKTVIRKWCEQAPEGAIEEMKINLLPEEQEWIRTYVIPFVSIIVIRCNECGYKLTKNSKLAEAIKQERGE